MVFKLNISFIQVGYSEISAEIFLGVNKTNKVSTSYIFYWKTFKNADGGENKHRHCRLDGKYNQRGIIDNKIKKKARRRWYSAEMITDADYINNPALILQLHLAKLNLFCLVWSRQKKALVSAWTQLNEFMCFNGAISPINGQTLKLVDKFIYLGSNISSTESDVNICIGKIRTTIDRLMTIW